MIERDTLTANAYMHAQMISVRAVLTLYASLVWKSYLWVAISSGVQVIGWSWIRVQGRVDSGCEARGDAIYRGQAT